MARGTFTGETTTNTALTWVRAIGTVLVFESACLPERVSSVSLNVLSAEWAPSVLGIGRRRLHSR